MKRSPETSAPLRTKRNLHERPSLGLVGILAANFASAGVRRFSFPIEGMGILATSVHR